MKTKIPALVLFIFAFINASAQPDPWTAKIMLHSVTGETDTLWIGCDENGGWGYQPGLDVIDTTLTYPGIWGYDSLIAEGECFNLKKDVKEFVTGIQKFNIQIADSFNQGGIFDYITIDTNEFKFDNGQFRITAAAIQSYNGYINYIDANYWLFLTDDTTDGYFGPFYRDSVSLIFEPNIFNCIQIDENQMYASIWLAFNIYEPTVLHSPPRLNLQIFPNPSSGIVTIRNFSHFKILELVDIRGKTRLTKTVSINNTEEEMHINNLEPGLYILRLVHTDTLQQAINYKILIF